MDCQIKMFFGYNLMVLVQFLYLEPLLLCMADNVETKLEESKRICVGCSACRSVCKFDAIRMSLDSEGFEKAVVSESACKECGACVRVCPQITGPSEGNPSPSSYAVKADAETLAASSSGGAFSLLAEWVLSKDGYVCGTVFDKDLNVVYIMTKDRSVVSRMRGSKYVFSEMSGIYDVIKKALVDSYVLFVGLPCQVQALKNYLGEDDRLYTVDLLCGGQPSKGIYRRYLSEISAEKPVSSLRFRSKDHTYGTLLIEYADGTEKVSLADKYYAAFNRHLIKSNACNGCLFSDTPKPGDLTIGDLWGAERYLRDVDPEEGVSVVLVNSEKGEEVFREIEKAVPYVRSVPLGFVKRFNRFGSELPVHPARRRLYSMLERGCSVRKAIDYCLAGRFDVGIAGLWRVDDYGGEASYYALFTFLRDKGMEPLLIESRSAIQGLPDEPTLLKTRYAVNSRARWYKSPTDQGELGARVFNFIAGPGPVWDRRIIGNDVIGCYALDFVSPWRNKISVASVIGTDSYGGSEEELQDFNALVGRLDKVSVGDESTREVFEKLGIEAKVILDPVFLCDPSCYASLIESSKAVFPDGFVMTYMMHRSIDGFEGILDHIGMGTMNVGSSMKDFNVKGGLPQTDVYYVENWLKCIKSASFVLTDSFYAVAFSIIFRKLFIAVVKDSASKGRMQTLLSSLGLERRMFGSYEEALSSGALDENIDYDEVHRKLSALREESESWLLGSLV